MLPLQRTTSITRQAVQSPTYMYFVYIYILNEVTYTQSCSRAVEVLYHTQLGKMSFDGILDFIDEVSLYFLKRVPVSSTSAQDGDALEGGVRL